MWNRLHEETEVQRNHSRKYTSAETEVAAKRFKSLELKQAALLFWQVNKQVKATI